MAEKGVKQIERISSAERGVTVTMCCCIYAIGNSFPPVYIFSRVHFKNYMLKGAPSENLGLAYPSGSMTSDLFAEAINHFIKFMKVSKSNPGVLLNVLIRDGTISPQNIWILDETGYLLLLNQEKSWQKGGKTDRANFFS